ncbi:hypothetical protein I2486_15465 [Cellulophaga sp. E16_2]|uniref:hypothetical protein n=1 Tax=Cellulophaga sp. E16_2 TaxID=2789297 RepID=UPI001A92304D|nr:hypothetical protein [Cellulophaga sp. E16_2]MBO0592802.1 hypothetical protein [Cellulophaga sp. E16_2]
MKYVVCFSCMCLVFSACFSPKKTTEITRIKYRIVNNTALNFTNVSLFSENIGNVLAYDTLAYAVVSYNSLLQDPLFYGINKEVNYARYLVLPKTNNERVTFSIDSLANKIIYISTK